MTTIDRSERKEFLERAFDRKRTNFLKDHELEDKPVLTWQAWPADEIQVDISNPKLHEALREGGGPSANDGWWYGFKSGRQPSLVFDGLSSESYRDSTLWATEVHLDGHICAGLWNFPECSHESSIPTLGVADFYVNAFRDFTYLAGKVFEAAAVTGVVHLTATMHQADKLALLADPGRVVVPAPKRKSLCWPIEAVPAAELARAWEAMAARFMRVYGKKAPKM